MVALIIIKVVIIIMSRVKSENNPYKTTTMKMMKKLAKVGIR